VIEIKNVKLLGNLNLKIKNYPGGVGKSMFATSHLDNKKSLFAAITAPMMTTNFSLE